MGLRAAASSGYWTRRGWARRFRRHETRIQKVDQKDRRSSSSWPLDTNQQSTVPLALGRRGNVVGSYDSTATLFLGLYGNWKF